MTGLGLWFILVFLLFFQTGSSNYAEILWGQCYAFCLTQHESHLYRKDDGDHGLTIKKCRRDRVCKWCLHACDRPREEYQYQEACLVHCQKTRPKDNVEGLNACKLSCGFIHQSFSLKYGSCPLITSDDDNNDDDGNSYDDRGRRSNGRRTRTTCEDQCHKDIDCDHMLKCCPGNCGRKCQRIVEENAIPPVPDRLKFRARHDGTTLIQWPEGLLDHVSRPVIYVLRWWCSYTDGVIVAGTTRLKLKLKGYNYPDGLHPGKTCHFMLAAVNQYGSQGFSPTQQYTKRFLRPSPPGNLERVRSKLHDDKVDITIQWQPPIYTDNLPILRYLVLWSDPLPKASPGYERRHMHNKTVDVDKTSYTIPRLEPGTVYFVQVRAVVHWKSRSIKGEPVSTYVETYPVPEAVPVGEEIDYKGDTIAQSDIYNISVSKPAFVQSQLKAGVTWLVHPGIHVMKFILYWAPSSCEGESKHRKTRDRLEIEATTHRQEFLLFDLQSECLYDLRIHAVSDYGEVDEGRRKHFTTPPCNATQGARLELCPARVSPPPSPVDVSMRLKTSSTTGCVCQAVISWTQAEEAGGGGGGRGRGHQGRLDHFDLEAQPPPVVSMWNIVWGESRPPSGSQATNTGSGLAGSFQGPATIVYNSVPYDTAVPWQERKACLSYLERSKHYTVQIIGQTGEVKGEPAVVHFVTPDYLPVCFTDGRDRDGLGDKTSEQTLNESSTAKSQSTYDDSNNAATLTRGNSKHQPCLAMTLTLVCVLVYKSVGVFLLE